MNLIILSKSQSIGISGPFSFGEHKTTEQTKVRSESDVYISSPPDPAERHWQQSADQPIEIDTDTSTIPHAQSMPFDSLSNTPLKSLLLNARSNRTVQIAGKSKPSSMEQPPLLVRLHQSMPWQSQQASGAERSAAAASHPAGQAWAMAASELLQLVQNSTSASGGGA